MPMMLLRCHPSVAVRRAAIAVCAGATGLAAWGQDVGSALTPTLAIGGSMVETRSRPIGAENGREFVATITPGLRYSSRSGRLQGALEYRGNLVMRRGMAETSGNELQNELSAGFVAEAVPNHLFVDARAGVSRQAISPFGAQAVEGSSRGDSNRTEVRTLTLSPSLRGAIGTFAAYDLQLFGSATRSRDEAGVDSNTTGGSIALRSATSGALLGWSLEAVDERAKYEDQEPVDNRRASAGVTLAPSTDVRLSLRGGRESLEVGTAGEPTQNDTFGGGLQWAPTPRTNFSFDAEKRYFGRSARVNLLHRTPRSIWTYSFTRDATDSADARGTGQPVTLFDLLFAQAASAYPDPGVRETVVRDLLSAAGQDPNQIVAPGFQSSAVSLQRRQDLSLVWLGQRTTFSIQGYVSSLSEIVFSSIAEPVIGEPVRQHGYSSSLGYRLTPLASIVFGGSRQMTFARVAEPGNDLKSAFASFTQQVGRQASATVVARYTVFNSPTDPYRETSVTASLNLRF